MRPRAVAALVAALLLLPAAAWLLRPLWLERRLRHAPRPLDVVVITLDTTRADRLGSYGGDPGVSPSLDALARRGVLFRQAFAHVPLTLPSHASLLTGRLPPGNGVRDNAGFVLGDGVPTLAEQFARAGYRTGAFVSAFVLDRRFGLSRGFGTYVDEVPADPAEPSLASCRADVTVGRALEWLAAPDPRPAFLWVHLYDPHAPYDPPEPFASRFRGRPYDGEIASMDAEIGRLLAALGARKRPALVAAIADHGEALGEHREKTHSYFIYGATQHVPFILSLPGWLPEGREVDSIVRGVDLAPTLLDVAGLPAPAGLDGRSLVELIVGRSREGPGPAYLESFTPRFHWGARELLGLRAGPWLYVRSPLPELYDVSTDPGETVNLAAERPAELEALEALLRPLAGDLPPPEPRGGIDAETERRLNALGYLSAPATPPADPKDLPDAKDNAEMLALFGEAEESFHRRDYAAALAGFRQALQQNPRALAPRSRVAETLLRLGRFDESLAAFRELGRERPGDEGHRVGMIRSLSSEGRTAEALAMARKGLESLPASARLHRQAGALLLETGKAGEAEAEFRRAADLAPREAGPQLGLGAALKALGRLPEAVSAYEAAIERSRQGDEAKQAAREVSLLAEELARTERMEDVRRAYLAAHRAGVSSEGSYLNLALACHRLRRGADAMDALREGARLFPESVDLHYRYGRLLLDAGRTSNAEAELRRALELGSTRNDVRLHLGLALQRAGRIDEAARVLRQVEDLARGSKEGERAREALSRLQATP